jgi:hypothetical protein
MHGGRYRIYRLPVLLTEHEVKVVPLRAGSHALGEMGRPVSPQRVTQRAGQCDRPTPRPRFRLHEDQALARLSLQRLAHDQRAGLEVDCGPGQPQSLPLS